MPCEGWLALVLSNQSADIARSLVICRPRRPFREFESTLGYLAPARQSDVYVPRSLIYVCGSARSAEPRRPRHQSLREGTCQKQGRFRRARCAGLPDAVLDLGIPTVPQFRLDDSYRKHAAVGTVQVGEGKARPKGRVFLAQHWPRVRPGLHANSLQATANTCVAPAVGGGGGDQLARARLTSAPSEHDSRGQNLRPEVLLCAIEHNGRMLQFFQARWHIKYKCSKSLSDVF
jgi:hypothetical protein